MAGIDTYTKLCLHMDESPNLLDSSDSNHTITKAGSADRSVVQSKFGGYSLNVSTIGDYLSASNHADWNFGSDNFTIDFWLRLPIGTTDIFTLVGNYHSPEYAWTIQWHSGSNLVRFWVNDCGSNNDFYFGDIKDNTWHHIALVRSGSDLMAFLDGTQAGSTIDLGNCTIGTPAGVLEIMKITENRVNYMDELRISKGTARWITDFTQPTEAYSSQTVKISGTKSETARIIVFDESDWSIEYNTVVSGSGAYEATVADTGDRTVLARANDGEIVGYGGVTPIEE